ncbi:YbaY family lipoprotein [Kriegella aquimaris]|uniref:Type III secretion system lipoprotein chaperone (YscW) n=1 Tax=Kriegella aquimaris TaxID=192904 RepID=A0A1G9RDY3_9FLAO|nr:YbaY family lipoprotein [Kriegella aquimaris]SDM21260.1 Type III secretion system lipoprotein chaperone (YscW) [Kriegella aquimaris]
MNIEGSLVLPASHEKLGDAKITVRILDVSKSDSVSETISELTLHLPDKFDIGDKLPFRFHDINSGQGKEIIISAHIDLNGNGNIDKGDFITTQSYPAYSRSLDNQHIVEVQLVN